MFKCNLKALIIVQAEELTKVHGRVDRQEHTSSFVQATDRQAKSRQSL